MQFSAPPLTSKPAARFHRLLFWRIVRWGSAGLAALLLPLALFYAEENWRGKRAWAAYQRVLKAKGVELNWHALEPPPVADERFQIDRNLPVRLVQDNPVYGGLIESMDTAVGRVLTCLHELGLETNTIVILTSDNGGVVSGDSYSSCMSPYRGGKGRQWEGGLRVPLYVRAPGITTPGSTCDTPMSGIDFYPTILALAGVPLPPQQTIDGVSLVPLLNGGAISDRPLFWHYPHYGNQGGEPSSIIREDGWKLIHYWEDNRNELYHLPADIGEQHDLASQETARAARLWAELQAWLKDTGAKIPQPYAGYDPADAAKLRQASAKLKARLEQQHADYLKPDWQPDPTWWKSLVTTD